MRTKTALAILAGSAGALLVSMYEPPKTSHGEDPRMHLLRAAVNRVVFNGRLLELLTLSMERFARSFAGVGSELVTRSPWR